jgi:trimeric autotransporter adhesin
MKNITQIFLKSIVLLIAICNLQVAFSQVPQKMSYQAVIRNASGALIANTNVAVRVSIILDAASGIVNFSERHSVVTNSNGLATFEIGTGTLITGDFSDIEWQTGVKFIKTESDPAGGTNYSIVGISQLTSVPYAHIANIANNANVSNDNRWTKIGDDIINNNQGNVGIGTSTPSPDYELTVRNETSGGLLKLESAMNNTVITMDDSGPDDVYLNSELGDFNIWTGGNNRRLSILTNGNTGIGTNAPTTKLEVNGFTKSGSDAPAVKVLKLTGTTNNFGGSSTLISHNLNSEKILAVNVLVGTNTTGKFCIPNNDQSSFQEYYVNVNPNDIEVKLGFNSSDILGKPIKIMITYEQ